MSGQVKMFFRRLRKNRKVSLVSILNFSLGISCTLILLLYVKDEIGYDQFPKSDRIYRVSYRTTVDGNVDEFATSSALLAQTLQADIPEVEQSIRIDAKTFKQSKISIDENIFLSVPLIASDPEFLNFFEYKVIAGDRNALDDYSKIILTRSLAQTIFGDTDPIGKSISLNDDYEFEVGAIVEGPSNKTHLPFSGIVPWKAVSEETGNWYDWWVYTYILLKDSKDVGAFEGKLAAFAAQHIAPVAAGYDAKIELISMPVGDISLHSQLYEEIRANGSIVYVRFVSLFALFFLLLFGINHVNLSVVSSSTRLKEIGLKKVFGMPRLRIAMQFMFESVILVFFSTIVALLILSLVLPYFNTWTGKYLSLSSLVTVGDVLLLVAGVIILGILSSIYTAVRLSRTEPVEDLRYKGKAPRAKISVQRFLTGFQFTASIISLICTLMVIDQFELIINADRGFNANNVAVFRMPDREQAGSFKSLIQSHPEVVSVTMSEDYWGDFITTDYKVESEGTMVNKQSKGVFVDTSFFSVLDIRLVAGRNFYANADDFRNSFIINEKAASEFGWSDALDKDIVKLSLDGEKAGKVIGVVNNFGFASLHSPDEPLIISLSSKTSAAYVYVKFSDKVSHQEALKKISEEHLKIFGTNKMQFEFLTDIIDRFYTHDIYIRKFLLFGSVIMLVISCVGLYGVSSYIVLQRTKEISLRKVLGASQVQVIALHLMPFINLLLITFPLACFGSYYFSMIWLQTFTHRAPIDVTNFMLPLLANLGILVLVIIGHAIKLSRVNPAETLKVQ